MAGGCLAASFSLDLLRLIQATAAVSPRACVLKNAQECPPAEVEQTSNIHQFRQLDLAAVSPFASLHSAPKTRETYCRQGQRGRPAPTPTAATPSAGSH